MICYKKKNHTSQGRNFTCGLTSLLPSRDQCKTRGREKNGNKKQKTNQPTNKNTSDKFWSGENAEGGSTLELGITYCPENWEGMRTYCRWQLLPVDAQITMARTSRRGVKEKTFPAIPKFSFSWTLLRPMPHMCNNILNRSAFLPKELMDKDEETWARIAFQTWPFYNKF